MKIDGIVSCVSPSSSFQVSKKLSILKENIIREASWVNYIQTLKIKSLYKNKNLFVALNRRYLSAVVKSKKIIDKINEIKFFSFYDQENTIKAKKNGHKKDTIKNWMYANSIHMVDLINFYVDSKIKNIENKIFYLRNIKDIFQ